MKNVSILGSTGSIGTQTLDVIRRNADINVVALAAGTMVSDLAEQVREFKPQLVCIGKEELVPELKTLIGDIDVKIVSGDEGLIEAATIESAEIVVTAVVGMMGITPTVEAIKAHKDIALANKETLVCAGHIIMSLAKECNVNIYPVDSEHSAIFQCLNGENRGEIEKILLTASGGPFRGKKRADLENVQLEDALKHPNWAMGRKITIDSSTMVNKGLEVMEAQWLFGVPAEKVQVIVQPQSIIHSMVEFKDGDILADMKHDIAFGSGFMKPMAKYELATNIVMKVSLGMMTVKEVLSELTDKLNIHGISIFCGNDMECIYSTGHYKNNVIEAAYVNDDKFLNHFDEYGVNMVNNIASLTIEFPEVFRKLRDNNICSLLQMKADGADGKEYMVEFDIFGTNRRKWSDTDVIMLRMVVLGVVNAISGQLTD